MERRVPQMNRLRPRRATVPPSYRQSLYSHRPHPTAMLRRFLAAAVLVPCAASAQENFDRAMIAKIRDEGLNHSQAWPMLDTLATVIGPRLAGSPAYLRAVNWSRDHLAAWGFSNVHLE